MFICWSSLVRRRERTCPFYLTGFCAAVCKMQKIWMLSVCPSSIVHGFCVECTQHSYHTAASRLFM